jgi:hypothetical protein
VRRREFIALLGGAAICAPLAARVFVFASDLAASAWHAHVNKLRLVAKEQHQWFCPSSRAASPLISTRFLLERHPPQ